MTVTVVPMMGENDHGLLQMVCNLFCLLYSDDSCVHSVVFISLDKFSPIVQVCLWDRSTAVGHKPDAKFPVTTVLYSTILYDSLR